MSQAAERKGQPNASPLGQLAPATRILTCVDGSGHLIGVCEHAAWLCSRLRGDIQLLSIDENRSAARPRRSDDPSLNAALGEALLRLSEIGVEALEVFRGEGSFVGAVIEMSGGAAAVVLGKRGRAQTEGDAFGASVRPVLLGSRAPVLLASKVFLPIERVLAFRTGAREPPRWPAVLLTGLNMEFASSDALRNSADLGARLDDDCFDLVVAPREMLTGDGHFAAKLASRRCSILLY